MKAPDFQRLLKFHESEMLDFKEQGYDLRGRRNAFIKDLLAMANTPREQDGHIVLGVRWTAEGGSTVVGLDRQYDDVEFQNALGVGRVQPAPRFTYVPFDYEGKKVGVILVPVSDDGPYTPINDFEDLQAGVIYYRRGTRNDRAVGSEVKRVVNWFAGRAGPLCTEVVNLAWQRFLDAAHRFESGRTFVLAVDRITSDTRAPIHALAMVPWRAVIDFDPASDESGLLSTIAGPLEKHRVIHRVVRGEYRLQPQPGTHWFFARGLSRRQGTVSDGDHKSWLRAYKQELGKQLGRLAAAISPTPIVVMVLWSDVGLRNHVRTLFEELHGAFGELVEILLVSNDAASFERLCEDAGATFVDMSLRSLCAGVADHFAVLYSSDVERCVLPTSAGAPIEIVAHDRLWLSEDLDLAHRGVGLQGEEVATEFRRGGEVSWRNLQLHHDCDRDVTPGLRSQVEADLRGRQTVRINLYHAPGAGGTTVGRRIAWDLHDAFPTALLRCCEPRNTADRIAKVAALTENSVLVVVDGGTHSERDIDDLYDFLKAGQTPVVLLQTLRRFQRQQTGKRQFWLDAQLSDAEADRFRDAYMRAAPGQAARLTELARRRNDPQRNAFFFGLTAFGRDFRGLGPYVERRIGSIIDDQRRILAYIAIAHYYGQQAIPAQAFARLLGLPRSRTVELRSVFQDKASPVLELLIESANGEWRTSHHLVALELMQQMLAPRGSQERERVWLQNLSSWGKDFGSFCRGDEPTASDRLLELVRRIFIYRDNVELLGTERAAQRRFAQLIEDIPSRHGQIEVLRHLTEKFPLEAHLHAHLGRLLGFSGEFKDALASIDFAISLQPDDHVPHHMRGMVIRQALRADGDSGAGLDQLVGLAKEASVSLEESRRLCPDLEHGYISEVQMLVDLLDRAGKGRDSTVRDVLARPETDPFLKRALDRAEDLLDRVQHLYAGEQPSGYAIECRARLQRIYGDYQTALQAWDNLLARPEVAKPPIRRQIVWTILQRRDRAWENLNRTDLERVRRLLEENLEEERNDSTSLRLWLRAVRQVQNPPSFDAVIEKVSYWKANTGALDAAYYLYVLHALRALEGSGQALADAERALEECRALSRFRRDRTRSFEWIGRGQGIQRLVHQSRLGEWRDGFWESTAALERVGARVAAIDAPQKGSIELPGGLVAFFVPVKAGLHSGRDESRPITCHVGFSYDGPRAWNARLND
jgi:hypothetical protein